MATKAQPAAQQPIPSFCTIGGKNFAVRVTALSSEGCELIAESSWPEESDFVRLSIGGDVEINGRAKRNGHCEASIKFFGHIHPVAVNRLMRGS